MKIVSWLLERLKEPSTYAGFAGVALAFGLSDVQWATVSTAVAGLAGVVAMFLADKASRIMKFLSALLGIINKLLGLWNENRWKQRGRQETIKEMNDAINEQIELGAAAVSILDPERDERLRDRFDRSRK
jgi:hypothetical protein